MGFVSPHADPCFLPLYNSPAAPANAASGSGRTINVGDEVDVFSAHLQHLTLDVDRLLRQHTEKVRVEVAERRERLTRRLLAAVESGTAKRLEAKDEEIARVRKLNCALEERVESLYAENQMWRGVARSNEAAASALRTDLEQVLVAARARVDQLRAASADDAESCCSGEVKWEEEEEELGGAEWRRRRCWRCRAREASVLLLPCRHLCLCAACTPTATACPVCNCCKNGSVTVNLC
ncbi:putative BOI-related E3 ubiquitin-protein ligase 3 [Curcuma longa]|uniref:putative BOI-related E3 ubiquitin-protein ligase 3 n=1 Tax=Curcuma longa TaxID=136217 RepID=UPI003D9F2062